MTDSRVASRLVRPLRFAEIVEYLGAKGVKPECSSCGNKEISIVCKDNADEVPLMAQSHPDFTKQSAFAAPFGYHLSILTECQNCGHMVQYSYHKIVSWLEARKQNGG